MKNIEIENSQKEIEMWRRRYLGAQDNEKFRKGVKDSFLGLTSEELIEHGPDKALKTLTDMWKGW